MVNTLHFRAPRNHSSPIPGGAVVPNLNDGLYAHWHYDDLPNITTGTGYAGWMDRVNAINLEPISGLDAPTRQPASLGGKGAVSFDYNESSATARGLQTAPGTTFALNAASTGVTFAVVAYHRNYRGSGGNATSRIFASRSSGDYYMLGSTSADDAGVGLITPAATGALYQPAGNAFNEKWFVAVGTITADETRLYVDDLPVMTGAGAGSTVSSGFRLGVNAAGAVPFTGYMREARVYKKALSDAHAKALIAKLRFEHLGS
jgi:hypothetical protein